MGEKAHEHGNVEAHRDALERQLAEARASMNAALDKGHVKQAAQFSDKVEELQQKINELDGTAGE